MCQLFVLFTELRMKNVLKRKYQQGFQFRLQGEFVEQMSVSQSRSPRAKEMPSYILIDE